MHSSIFGKVRPVIHCTETIMIFMRFSVRTSGRSVSIGKTQTVCFERFQVLEGRENVGLGSHLGHVDLECDEAAEDGCKVRRGEVVYGIRGRKFHVGRFAVRAAACNVKVLVDHE